MKKTQKNILFGLLCVIYSNMYAQIMELQFDSTTYCPNFIYTSLNAVTNDTQNGFILPSGIDNYSIKNIELCLMAAQINDYLAGARDEKTMQSVEYYKKMYGSVPTKTLKHEVKLLVYTVKAGTCVILDRNYNQDFTDDAIFVFDRKKKDDFKEIMLTLDTWYEEGFATITTKYHLRYIINNTIEDAIALEKKRTLRTDLCLNNKTYTLLLALESSCYPSDYAVLYGNCDPTKGLERTFKEGDVIKLDNKTNILLKKYDGITCRLTVEVLPENYAFTGFKVNYKAPIVAFKTLDGATHSTAEYKGKYLILDFWGTWCPPCLGMIPDLVQFNDKIKAYQNYSFVSVACEPIRKEKEAETVEKLKNIVAQKKMAWTQGYCNSFEETSIAQILRITSYPGIMVIAPDGTIQYVCTSLAEIRAILQKIISTNGAPLPLITEK